MKKIMLFLLLFTLVFSISFAQLAGVLSQYGNYIFLGAFCALIAMICQISLSRVNPRYGNIGILLGVIIFIYLMINQTMANTVLTFIAPYTAIIIGIAAIYILINLFKTVGTHHGNWGKMIFGIGLVIVTAYAANIILPYIPPTIGYARMIFNIIIAFGALLFIWGLLGLVLPHVKAVAPGPMGFGHGPKPPGAPSPPPPLIIKEVKEEYKVDMDAMNVINEIISSLQKKDDPNKIENRIKNLEHLIRDEEKRVGKVASILHQLQDYEAKLNEAILPLHQTWGKAGRRAKELQSEIMKIRHRIDAYRKDHFLPMIADLGNIERSIRENSRQIEQLIASMRSHLQRALSTKGDAQAAVIVEDYPRALRDALSIKQILEAEISRLNTAYTEAQRVMHGVKGFQDALARLQSQVQQLRHEVEI